MVVGAGYIGLELGTAFAKLGSSVTIVEATGFEDPAALLMLTLSALFCEGAEGLRHRPPSDGQGKGAVAMSAVVERSDGAEMENFWRMRLVGRRRNRPSTTGAGLEELDLDRAGPYLRIGDQCRTSMRGVYAIGDITDRPDAAHRAMAQGEMMAEIIAGRPRSWDKRCIPAVCFTDPEIVSAGLSPEEARAQGYEIGRTVPFSANGRAMTMQSEDGFVRVGARRHQSRARPARGRSWRLRIVSGIRAGDRYAFASRISPERSTPIQPASGSGSGAEGAWAYACM